MDLSRHQVEALRELEACRASMERMKLPTTWFCTTEISGGAAARSSRTLLSLERLGLIEAKRDGGSHRQARYSWRITAAGRAAIANEEQGCSLAGRPSEQGCSLADADITLLDGGTDGR